MIRAAVFDMDGLLLDTETYWDETRARFVADHGGHWTDADQVAVMGLNSLEWAHYIRQRFDLATDEQRIIDGVTERMLARYAAEGAPLLPGAVDVVRTLASRLPLAVASSSPRRVIEAALRAASLRDSFQVLVSSDDVPRGKPDPAVYLEAARRLDVPATDCLAFEDSTNGLLAAQAAGMIVVAVPNHRYPPAPHALANAALVLPSLVEFDLDRLDSSQRRAAP